LFGEPGFSTTADAEISILDTDFGVQFGMFICFDIMFEKPAVQLVKEWEVTDIVYPTAWFSELPFLTGKLALTGVKSMS
jgi:predicted amidohydrolase